MTGSDGFIGSHLMSTLQEHEIQTLSHDLREHKKVEEQIKNFLSERYSSYILYEPPVNNQNIILWFGPLVFIVILSYFLFRRYIR